MQKIKITLDGFGGELNIRKIDSKVAKVLNKKADGDYVQIIRSDEKMAELGLRSRTKL
jgi:hypothetical protein